MKINENESFNNGNEKDPIIKNSAIDNTQHTIEDVGRYVDLSNVFNSLQINRQHKKFSYGKPVFCEAVNREI